LTQQIQLFQDQQHIGGLDVKIHRHSFQVTSNFHQMKMKMEILTITQMQVSEITTNYKEVIREKKIQIQTKKK
jgi:hypothetical protein